MAANVSLPVGSFQLRNSILEEIHDLALRESLVVNRKAQ